METETEITFGNNTRPTDEQMEIIIDGSLILEVLDDIPKNDLYDFVFREIPENMRFLLDYDTVQMVYYLCVGEEINEKLGVFEKLQQMEGYEVKFPHEVSPLTRLLRLCDYLGMKDRFMIPLYKYVASLTSRTDLGIIFKCGKQATMTKKEILDDPQYKPILTMGDDGLYQELSNIIAHDITESEPDPEMES